MRALQQLHEVLGDVLAEGDGNLRVWAHRLQAESLMVSASSQDFPGRTAECTLILLCLDDASHPAMCTSALGVLI